MQRVRGLGVWAIVVSLGLCACGDEEPTPAPDSGGSSSGGSSSGGSSSGGSSSGGSSSGGSSSGGSSSGGSSSGGSSSGGVPLAERCDAAASRVQARYDACEVDYEIIDGGEVPECTEALATSSEAVADCLDDVTCAAMRGDADAPQAEKDAYYACLSAVL